MRPCAVLQALRLVLGLQGPQRRGPERRLLRGRRLLPQAGPGGELPGAWPPGLRYEGLGVLQSMPATAAALLAAPVCAVVGAKGLGLVEPPHAARAEPECPKTCAIVDRAIFSAIRACALRVGTRLIGTRKVCPKPYTLNLRWIGLRAGHSDGIFPGHLPRGLRQGRPPERHRRHGLGGTVRS